MTFTVLDAPSNLGLRPPAPGVEPGVRRLAELCVRAGSSSGSARATPARSPRPHYDASSVAVNRRGDPGATR